MASISQAPYPYRSLMMLLSGPYNGSKGVSIMGARVCDTVGI